MISGLTEQEFKNFQGKSTDQNLTAMNPQYLLSAKNCIVLGDGNIRKAPGYTSIKTVSSGSGKFLRQFYWKRDADGSKFVLFHRGTAIAAMDLASGAETTLKTSESSTDSFDFINNYFAAYGANGQNAYKFCDNAGTLSAYQWGINAPLSAPTVSTSAGSLSLTYGRQAVMCFVSYITDLQGNQRIHVSAPSPLTAHTGPLTNAVITYGGLEVSSDPQVTHKWIFETMDSQLNSTSAFYFSGEVTNATTSYGSSLADSALDTTRLAPFDNHPAPAGSILAYYQNRAVIAVGNKVYASGYEEIDLGIPQEAFPADLFFELPEDVTALAVVNEGQTLLLGTEAGWYLVTGYDATTFTKRDRVLTPGCAGKKAVCSTPTHMIWLGTDKVLYAWDYGQTVSQLSSSILFQMTGTYSMQDLKDSELSNVEVFWFSHGKHNFIGMLANTSDQGNTDFNWFALWFVNIKSGSIQGVMQTDIIPTDLLSSACTVLVNGMRYLYVGDASTGDIYRWPDGFNHNGDKFQPSFGLAWSNCGKDATKRFYWADVFTNQSNTVVQSESGDPADDVSKVKVLAVVSNAPNMFNTPQGCSVSAVRAPAGSIDASTARANMQQAGTSVGKWMRLVVTMPEDEVDFAISKVAVYSKPIFGIVP